jgi:hypothetical protein
VEATSTDQQETTALQVVMRGQPEQVSQVVVMVLSEPAEIIPYLMATLRLGILFLAADQAEKGGRGALSMMQRQAERVVRVAMAQVAIALMVEQAMAEKAGEAA